MPARNFMFVAVVYDSFENKTVIAGLVKGPVDFQYGQGRLAGA